MQYLGTVRNRGVLRKRRMLSLCGVSLPILALSTLSAFAQQIVVGDGQEKIYDDTSVYAHTTANAGSSDAAAVFVENGTLSIKNSKVKLQSDGRAAEVLKIGGYSSSPSSRVTIWGSEAMPAEIIATGDFGDVISLSDQGSILDLQHVKIEGLGPERRAILTMGESELSLRNSDILVGGDGIRMQGKYGSTAASVSVEDTTITSLNGGGIRAQNGSLKASNFIIRSGFDAATNTITTNQDTYGVSANTYSDVTLTNGYIETWGRFGTGVEGSNNTSDTSQVKLRMDNVDIITHGNNATGADNINIRSVINGGSIHTYGRGSHGVGSSNGGVASWAPSHVTLTGTRITTEGESAYGLVATTKSTIDGRGLIISTSGESAIGARSNSTGRVMLSQGTAIKTAGDYAHGAAVVFGSQMDISDTRIETTGQNAAGIYLVGYNTPENVTPVTKHVNRVNVAGSTITAAKGPALRVGGGATSTFNLANSHVRGTGDEALLFSSADYIYDDGTNVIPMPVGTASVNAQGSLMEGDIVAASGTVDFNLRDNSLLKGAARVSDTGGILDALVIDDTSGWEITGTSTLKDLESAGTISFAEPGAAGFKTLTVKGDFTSADSLFVLNSKLGDDGSETDRLIFEGNVSGASRVSVNNAGGLGALTLGDGIMIVDAAKASNDAFVQQGRIAAGAYDYTLFAEDRSGNFDGRWYLRSTYNPAPTPDPDPDPEPDPNPGPDPKPEPELPNYRPEVPLDMVAPVLANRFGLAMLGTYHDRRDTLDPNLSAFWLRGFGEHGHAGSASGNAQDYLNDFYRDGPSYDFTLGGFQAGIDLYRREQENGSRDLAGLFIGAGRAEANVDRVYGGNAGQLTMNGYSFGGYWTHLDQVGFYTDAVIQGTRYDRVESSSADQIAMRTAGWGFISSLEGGYSHGLGNGWTVEPQAQLIYQHLSLDNTSDRFGRIAFSDTDTVYGRVGAKIGRQWQAESGRRYAAWARVNLWHTIGGEAKTSFSNLQGENRVSLASDAQGSWGQFGLGFSGQLTETVSLFASGDYSHSLGHNGVKNDSLAGRVGLKMKW
ncbi:autotransporter outer membrane beta-barrel domain-containing protein [Brucella pituitosa]|uniref:autotransporter family protein n=1 Tax=Brucella pituitosa TaxID=571256 RepID=UPI0009A22D27|nr:autotransporter outer membrane beta-barrel domain-containing protein [Brucella pituitosa]